MGTSTSSSGPKGGVSFDPPWVDQLVDDIAIPASQAAAAVGVAPPARFRAARSALKHFAVSGDRSDFRRAVGHYSRSGMGGAKNASARMRVSSVAGAALGELLVALQSGALPPTSALSYLIGTAPAAQDIIDAIVREVSTSGGSFEEESCADSMEWALSQLLVQEPNADLFHLTDEHIWTVLENFLAAEANARLTLDIGQLFESMHLSPKIVVARLTDVRDYLRAEVRAQMNALKTSAIPNAAALAAVLDECLRATFAVYEGYA